MVTESTSAAAPGWDQPALPVFWTNDLPTARASLLKLAVDAGIALPPLTRAIEQAVEAHRGQVRKGTEAPYAVHPIRLACALVESFGVRDVDLLCAALLHDVLEETETTRESLAEEYGPRCADLVAVLSRLTGEERPATGDSAGSPYLQRIRGTGDAAVLIKLADKIDNLRDAISHPDKRRVAVFVDETFQAYVPLARSLTDARLARRTERLLLEAAGRTGGIGNPRFLKALLATVSRCADTDRDFSEVPFPAVATTLYCFFNPEARMWLEFDGIAITHEHLPPRDLAPHIASRLRRKLSGPELAHLLEIGGIPPAFAARSNDLLWRRAAAHLERLQRLLTSEHLPPWLSTLFDAGNEPSLLALVQSSTYLPASWRCPLWAEDLGAVLSDRIRAVSDSPAAGLPSFVLAYRLALTRYADGTGTRGRASHVFEHDAVQSFPAAALWALRLGMEALQSGAIDELWQEVQDAPFVERSLPARAGAIPGVETVGLRETATLFADAGAEEQFAELIRRVTREPFAGTRWIVFDHDEWRKRRPRWSQPGRLSLEGGDLEAGGARVIRRQFGDTELLTILPARNFALQDRLPEMTVEELETIDRLQYSAAGIFDVMISGARETLWMPRVYRIIDTVEDLDPDSVQAVRVEYEGGGEAIPSLQAFLPLPSADEKADVQTARKRLLARYLAAQIYSCGVVRRMRRVHISCAAVTESRRESAFTDAELRDEITAAEKDLGLRAAFRSYIERYAFDPFGVTAGASDYAATPFGAEEMRQGVYAGIDIGATGVKIAVARAGHLLDNPGRPEIPTPKGMTVATLCDEILGYVSRELQGVSVRWTDISGIGVSWPGAVRENRIVGMSGVLQGLTHEEQGFSPADPLDRLGSFDFLAVFRERVREAAARDGSTTREDLALAIVNDGDAEAFGTHALRTLKGLGKPGGKIFVKLGTSLAGGRITASGAVAEDVAEYSKIVLQLPPAGATGPWAHLARAFVSAEGVRNLSRTFVFDGALLFGERGGANRADNGSTRIEPVELGQLLPLFADVSDELSFLDDLVRTDNRSSVARIERAIAATAAALQNAYRPALVDYIRRRGLERTLWLCDASTPDRPQSESLLPETFPFRQLARTIVGTVALFSQLGLHVAHLIAQLYNIYRRGTFTEVVLAGGVLSGRSGEIVENQSKGFLRKYYDKIYGEGKPLGPDTLVRAGFENVSNPGVFGAAMAASRQWQVERDRLLDRRIEEHLRLLPMGEEVALEELLAVSGDSLSRDRALRLLERHLATGEIARTPSGRIQKIS